MQVMCMILILLGNGEGRIDYKDFNSMTECKLWSHQMEHMFTSAPVMYVCSYYREA